MTHTHTHTQAEDLLARALWYMQTTNTPKTLKKFKTNLYSYFKDSFMISYLCAPAPVVSEVTLWLAHIISDDDSLASKSADDLPFYLGICGYVYNQ